VGIAKAEDYNRLKMVKPAKPAPRRLEEGMIRPVTIRIKTGNMEVEVTGPKAWAEEMIKKVIKWYREK
jgi:hypothetical protein